MTLPGEVSRAAESHWKRRAPYKRRSSGSSMAAYATPGCDSTNVRTAGLSSGAVAKAHVAARRTRGAGLEQKLDDVASPVLPCKVKGRAAAAIAYVNRGGVVQLQQQRHHRRVTFLRRQVQRRGTHVVCKLRIRSA